jgi:ornithine carbamoyltransferase
MSTRHFLTLLDCSPAELNQLIDRAIELKASQRQGQSHESAKGKVMAMIFEKSSTRTRVSFEAGMAQLGGHAMFLSPADTQLGRGEPVEDTARVISRMVDIVMIRTHEHARISTFAEHSQVPVINALTDSYHPCQLLADIQTYVEHRGSIQGCKVAWIGDGNNMCHSYINAARQWDFELAISSPEGFDPDADLVADNSSRVFVDRDPLAAARGANLIVTDTWASMGQEMEQEERKIAFAPYQVNEELMDIAAADAIFMHCLPAYRGCEVTTGVLENESQSVVWDEAENRLHAQKALIEFLLSQ